MSIINEALKKTEEYLQKNSAKDNPLPPKPPGPKPLLLYILILLAGLALGNFIFNLLSYKIQTTAQTSEKNAFAVIPAANSPPLPALPSQLAEKTKPVETGFVLNGIFFSNEDGGYALVNNQIVRENDYVDGAK
ncbi:MAG: hypothetical protein Q8O02_03595, partial [Candidatus Omnitrophota bacterium]|nr:hypothetical protein [Candidatus Omnitrophota bacterium]